MHDHVLRAHLEQRGIGGRVVGRVVAVLEAAACLDGEIRRTFGIGQLAQLAGDDDVDLRLRREDAGVGQLQDDELVAGASAVGGGVDDHCRAGGICCQRVGGVAGGIEGQRVGGDGLAKVGRRDEGDAVIDFGAGAVLAGGRQDQVDEGREAGLSGGFGVAEAGGEAELAAEEDIHGRCRQRHGRQRVGQQAVPGAGGEGAVDGPLRDLQSPVAASRCAAGGVVRGSDVGAGQFSDVVDQRPSGVACSDVAAVEEDVGVGRQSRCSGTQRIGGAGEAVGRQRAAAQHELAGATVRQNLDRGDRRTGGEAFGDRGEAVLGGIDEDDFGTGSGLLCQLLIIGQPGVDDQQRARWSIS